MDESVVLQVLRTSQRVRPFEQGWTADRKKRVAQQEGRFEASPAPAAVTNADIHSLRSEVNEPAAGIDAQIYKG